MENLALEADFRRHREDGELEELVEKMENENGGRGMRKATESPEELEDDNSIYFLIIFTLTGLFIIVVVLLVVQAARNRKPSRKIPRSVQAEEKKQRPKSDSETRSLLTTDGTAAMSESETEGSYVIAI